MISTDDLAQVNDLFSRYFWLIDEAQGEPWSALFTEDGVLEEPGRDPVRGRAALAAVAAQVKQAFGRGMRHTYSNLVCDYEGPDRDRIAAKLYSHVTLYETLSGTFGMALIRARLVRQADGWKIERSTVEFLTPKAAG
jgi:hypothetical protein